MTQVGTGGIVMAFRDIGSGYNVDWSAFRLCSGSHEMSVEGGRGGRY